MYIMIISLTLPIGVELGSPGPMAVVGPARRQPELLGAPRTVVHPVPADAAGTAFLPRTPRVVGGTQDAPAVGARQHTDTRRDDTLGLARGAARFLGAVPLGKGGGEFFLRLGQPADRAGPRENPVLAGLRRMRGFPAIQAPLPLPREGLVQLPLPAHTTGTVPALASLPVVRARLQTLFFGKRPAAAKAAVEYQSPSDAFDAFTDLRVLLPLHPETQGGVGDSLARSERAEGDPGPFQHLPQELTHSN